MYEWAKIAIAVAVVLWVIERLVSYERKNILNHRIRAAYLENEDCAQVAENMARPDIAAAIRQRVSSS